MDKLVLAVYLVLVAYASSKPTGKEAKQCKEAIGIQTGFLEDRDVKTSSAQKNFTVSDAWCSTQTNDKQFFAMDLGEDFLFTKVATQGKVDDRNRFIKTYELQFSNDNKDWKPYLSEGKSILEGNKDTFTVKYHKLGPDAIGRYVKLVPKSWNNGICSRMELYGCAVEDLKKAQGKDKIKSNPQSPAAKTVAPSVKSSVTQEQNVPDAVKSALESVNGITETKVLLPDTKSLVPDAKNAATDSAAALPQSQVPVAKSQVPVPKSTKEVPKRDSEANWSFATIGNTQNAADATAADNADLLELSRQLGTPTRR